mmetsp:Transcript_20230/g.56381  ORF Transcript_20230/g.56381 Transcript_20230/m.56381 type:complete len:178 (-) Transcript_20230:585-1118(-)|eukprot:CAMPEP_0198110532 /NCGR_PEP_ID=MMETSP1442-20131203/2542_1 /TAXON_ID= /ORGANISM="Craspedostauros australis, Strain CCMP3328" /LENGTH=177 /DNA_ID=CAMNT_0043766637 /DNA_START=368 /DNA_END=901 /DNA_ORIENTATION=+
MDPTAKPETIEEHLAGKYGPAAAARLRDPNAPLNKMGRENGIKWDPDRNVYATHKAHALIDYVQQNGGADANDKANRLMEVMYQKYFEEGADISNTEVLATFAKAVDVSAEEVAAAVTPDKQAEVTKKVDATRRKFGVRGVPFVVIDSNKPNQTPTAFSGAYPADVIAEQLEEAAQA